MRRSLAVRAPLVAVQNDRARPAIIRRRNLLEGLVRRAQVLDFQRSFDRAKRPSSVSIDRALERTRQVNIAMAAKCGGSVGPDRTPEPRKTRRARRSLDAYCAFSLMRCQPRVGDTKDFSVGARPRPTHAHHKRLSMRVGQQLSKPSDPAERTDGRSGRRRWCRLGPTSNAHPSQDNAMARTLAGCRIDVAADSRDASAIPISCRGFKRLPAGVSPMPILQPGAAAVRFLHDRLGQRELPHSVHGLYGASCMGRRFALLMSHRRE